MANELKARYQAFAQDVLGNVLGSATITVRRESDSALASLFSHPTLDANTKTNPFTSDADGYFFFHTYGGVGGLRIDVTKGALTRTFRYVPHGTAALYDLASVIVPASEILQGVAELATQAEAEAKTDDVRIMTALKVNQQFRSQPEVFMFAVSDETTNLTTGAGKLTFRLPYALEGISFRASVNTAPVGSTIIVDVNKNGSTMMTTNKLSIDASEKTSVTAATAAGVTTTTASDDDEITVDIDQIGSSTPGKGLKVYVYGNKV